MEEEEIKNLLDKKKGQDKDYEQALEQNDELATMNFHKLDSNELFTQLGTDGQKGLSEGQAADKLKEFGPNKLEEKLQYPWYVKLLLEMVGIFSLLLWAGAILCFIAYGLAPTDPTNV